MSGMLEIHQIIPSSLSECDDQRTVLSSPDCLAAVLGGTVLGGIFDVIREGVWFVVTSTEKRTAASSELLTRDLCILIGSGLQVAVTPAC